MQSSRPTLNFNRAKVAYKALQKSQIAEKQAASSKRRFVSCPHRPLSQLLSITNIALTDIFHEVRVPLNSAMLAYQNLQSNEAFKPLQEDQAVEIHALEGSLTVMQQVLNDVLGNCRFIIRKRSF